MKKARLIPKKLETYYTVAEIADNYKLSKTYVWDLIKSGKLKHITRADTEEIRVSNAEAVRFFERNKSS